VPDFLEDAEVDLLSEPVEDEDFDLLGDFDGLSLEYSILAFNLYILSYYFLNFSCYLIAFCSY